MSEVVIILIGLAVVRIATRGLKRWERQAAFASFGAHVGFAWVQVWLYSAYYGISDMQAYFDEGKTIAKLLDLDFSRFAPEVAKLALHIDNMLPVPIVGEGDSTGTMAAIAGFVTFVCGPSPVAACLAVGAFATVGQILIYRAAASTLTSEHAPSLAVGSLFVPSVVFWSSAFSKEGLALGFFGLICYSAVMLSSGRRALAAIGVAIGGIGVGVLKPYILFPLTLAIAAWYYVRFSRSRKAHISFLSFIGAALLAGIGIAALGALFPHFAVDRLGENAATQQQLGEVVGGGSFTAIGNDQARSMSEQLRFIPLALLNSLFRPILFEARNAPMFAAALESTALVIAIGTLAFRFRWSRVKEAVFGTPFLAFAVVFVLTFGTAVGLVTTNLGTLSRYRMPMMPFYVAFVLILRRTLMANLHAPTTRRLVSGAASR